MRVDAADKPEEFHAVLGSYLRARNLRADSVEDYYIVFTLFYLLNRMTLHRIGISSTEDEIRLPDEATWKELTAKYLGESEAISFELVQYFCQFLEEDPLSK